MFKLWKTNDPLFERIFRRHVTNSLIASRELLGLLGDIANASKYFEKIMELERASDGMVRECHELLDQTFITRIDKSDIAGLIQKLDDIIDGIKATAGKINLYHIEKLQGEVGSLIVIVAKMVGAVDDLLREINDPKPSKITEGVVLIKELEEEADQVLYIATERIFREEMNSKTLIQWKDIFETIDSITDSCEDVADLINSISRKGI